MRYNDDMKRYLGYLKGYVARAAAAPVMKLCEVVLELFIPILVASVVDKGIPAGDVDFILERFGLMIAFGFGGLSFTLVSQYFSAKTASVFASRIRGDLFHHIEELPIGSVEKYSASGLVTLLSSDVNNMQTGMNLTLRLLLRSPFVVLGVVAAVFIIDVQIGTLFLMTVFVLSVLASLILYFGIRKFNFAQISLDEMTELAREAKEGAKVFRALNAEQKEYRLFEKSDGVYRRRQTSSALFSSLLDPLSYAVINVAVVLLLWFGGVKVQAGSLSQGETVALYNYAALILTELIKFASLIISMSRAFAGAKRISFVLDLPSEENKLSEKTPSTDGYVVFNDVSFHYEGARGNALSHVDFAVQKGEKIGIIGGSGSGKTTLLDLLVRLYPVTEGNICLNGKDTAAMDLADVRKSFAYALQRSELFAGTVTENLSAGQTLSQEDIYSAVQRAQASSVINKKGGMEYRLAPSASDLSGGQRQRLSVARAFAKNAPILLLDDSLSALDGETSAALCEEIFRTDGTVFFASQRVSALKKADKILVLEEGKMKGFAPHDELIRTCETYRKICEAQP